MDIFRELVVPILSVAGLGAFFGLALAAADHMFAVQQDSRVEEILEALPGVNCGACGYPGCGAFAEAVAKGKAPVNGCPVGRKKVADEIARIMEVTGVGDGDSYVAKLACRGNNETAKDKMIYHGIQDCRAAALIDGGSKSCPYGCLGLGTCIRVCPFEAITMGNDGLPIFHAELCTGCNRCKNACPKQVIRMVPGSTNVEVMCNSLLRGAAVLKACKVGCIACGKCVKVCPTDAITIIDNLAVIDQHECISCGACIDACPTKTIIRV